MRGPIEYAWIQNVSEYDDDSDSPIASPAPSSALQLRAISVDAECTDACKPIKAGYFEDSGLAFLQGNKS
jgi:hypothetical protein